MRRTGSPPPREGQKRRQCHSSLDPWIEKIVGVLYADGERITTHTGSIYGLAVDVGTTTVVLHIVDLESSETLAAEAFENP